MLTNRDSEAYVLGAILLDNNVLHDVRDILSDEDFSSASRSDCYRALTLQIADGHADEVTLAAATGLPIEKIYLLSHNVPTTVTARQHALQVATASRLRQLHALCTEVAEAAESARLTTEDDALQFFADAQKRFVEATSFARPQHLTSQQVMRQVLDTVEERRKTAGTMPGISTGWPSLDTITLGLRRKQLVVVGAKTGVGKTAFALGLARSVARAEKRVLFVSHEMGADELGQRMISAESRVAVTKLEMGTLDDRDFSSLGRAFGTLSQAPIVWTDNPPSTIPRLRAECQQLKRAGGLDVVVVDYLQLMTAPGGGAQNREREIGEISRGLKKIAMELDLTVVALSQLNRKTERFAEPTLADLRDSGSIEQDANVVVLLWTDSDESPEVHGRVAKHRGGPVGTFELIFKRFVQRFEERVSEYPTNARG